MKDGRPLEWVLDNAHKALVASEEGDFTIYHVGSKRHVSKLALSDVRNVQSGQTTMAVIVVKK